MSIFLLTTKFYTENTICLKGFNSDWDGTFSRTVSDVSYSWPEYYKVSDSNVVIARGIDSSAGESYWVGHNNGNIEWGAFITNCGTKPYNILNCGYSTAGNIQGDELDFSSGIIISGFCPPPTSSPTTETPTNYPTSDSPTTANPTTTDYQPTSASPTTDYPTFGSNGGNTSDAQLQSQNIWKILLLFAYFFCC